MKRPWSSRKIPPPPASPEFPLEVPSMFNITQPSSGGNKSKFEREAGVERFDLIQTFYACKQEEGKLVSSYVLKMKGYVKQLESLGYVVSQDISVGLILNGLTSDFARFVRNYNTHNIGTPIVELHALLIEYEKGLPKKDVTPQVMAIQGGRIQKANKKSFNSKGKGKGIGNKKDKSYIPKPKNPKTFAKEHSAKDDTCHHCKEKIKNQLKRTIKALRSDRGGEYISQEFKDYLKACGIVQQLTPPYTPQHNEDYALKTVTYILNMVPTKKVDKTPYELWYGKVPNLSYLKVWGCKALVKRDTLDKLQQRSVKCIFIGYPIETMGYYFYFPSENKIVVARYTELLEKNLLSQEVSGMAEELKEIQDKDISHSKNTSKIHMEVKGFEQPQKEVVPARRDLNEPGNYKAALLDLKSDNWVDAMNAEIQSMKDNQVWFLVDLPPNSKGFTQTYGVDYKETFSPDADIRAIRILIAIATFYEMDASKLGYIPMQERADLNKAQGASTPEEVKLDWKIFKQSTTVMFATEAKYIAALRAVMEVVWIESNNGITPYLLKFLHHYHFIIHQPFIMTTPNITLSTDSQMHNNIMAADSRDHPPMLATGRYPQWRLRFLRYIDTRPNGEALRKCILSGPYKPTTVLVQAVEATDDSPAVPEHMTVETPMNMSLDNKAHFLAEKEVIHLILTRIGDEIYSAVDACQTAHEMWEAIERLQQGESLNIQDVKTNLFWEFGKFTSHDGETMESYYTIFYKLMNEMIRNNLTVTTMQVNVQFLQQLQPKWSRSSAPSSKPSIPTKSHTTTRHKGKEIAKPITPPAETSFEEDNDPEQAQRENDMQKNLALIAKYFKKIYKPTNNNLRTSSNSKNKNVDMTPRYKNDYHSGQFGNHRTVNVAGTREKVGSPVVQKSRIQCFNRREFRHFAKECRKPKRVKDSAYHKEKMLVYKQAEQGVPLQAEQYDWLADTDEEVDEQELEAHYSCMAKIQEVPTADSCIDSEPVEQVQNNAGYNVFANDLQHSRQFESVSNTCLVETNDRNVTPDSLDMCEDDIQNDQNDVESDDERVALANLIANLKLDVDENKKIQKQLKQANTTLAQELKECKTILTETKIVDNAWIKHSKDQFRAPTAQDIEILIQTCLMPLAIKTQNDSFKFVHELKQEMHADLEYVESLKKEIDELESDKAEFSNMYDVILQDCISKDVMCSYLQSLSDLYALDELQRMYLHKVKECDCLAQKISKQTESVSKKVHIELLQRFDKVEKHLISLEIALQKCKEQVKNDTVCNEKASNVFRKEREQYFEIQDLRAQLQGKNIAISELKKLIEKGKGKSVDTKFDRPSVVRQPNAQRIPKPLIVQLILFIVDSGCTKHMTGNLKLLCNFVEKFMGTVRFGNDQFALILGYGDLVQENVTINRVYYVEGLNHNLFSVGQFCDADLEVAFRKSTCFVRDLQGNYLLTGNRGSDLYMISLQESTSLTPLCLMAKATPTQAWLWHRRLSHLNFDYINLLSKKDIVISLPS
uniref:Retrotransposon protein, putative, Ty1-copia subclass n=1 Tax=Tanacetum cinerariifolium TaxID=118510 RepID=A0A6L2MMJ0_TANCI|nr:retrotransposon protein, putative, Ty1-copia subclass [Tanacetum cinerariifolium]